MNNGTLNHSTHHNGSLNGHQNGKAPIGVRRLKPENTRIFTGEHGLLHCAIGDEEFRGVFAVLLFPVRHPDQFVSLCHTDNDDKTREIGVIEDLTEFSEEAVRLIHITLEKHYHEQRITRIFKVKMEFGMLFFDAETERGREEFIMPWRHDRTEDFDEHGKVLLDALDNRYIIPNVLELPDKQRLELTRYIYW